MHTIRLFDYQEQMLRRIRTELAGQSQTAAMRTDGGGTIRPGRSVMVQMPTGTGKTYVMAAVIRQRTGRGDGEVWVIAHRRELVEQMERTLERFGIEYAVARDASRRETAGVRVMSIQWLSRNASRLSTRPAMIVIDEAHHSVADSYRRLWCEYPEAQKLGFTATPCRMKPARFSTLFDVLLTSWSISEFIRRGRLSLYDYVVTNRNSEEQLAIDSLERRGADGDYSVAEMEARLNVESAVSRLYHSVDTFARGRKGIVYAIDIRHARHIAGYYSERGLLTAAVDSRTPAALRARLVSDFRENRLDCIVNVNLFDEGFDCPDVEFIQMARPTLSLSKYMQMIGRGLRVHPDKKMCVMIDNVGLCRMFGLPDAERDWQAMFNGLGGGRGTPVRRRRHGTIAVDNGMEVVAAHSRLSPLTAEERERFLAAVEPFEKGGRWGLRVGDEVILRPVYRHITPFVGKYSTFELIPGRWGVLLRNGKRYIDASFKKIELLPDGDAILTRSEISRRRVHLDTTLRDETDIWEWWGETNVNLWEYS